MIYDPNKTAELLDSYDAERAGSNGVRGDFLRGPLVAQLRAADEHIKELEQERAMLIENVLVAESLYEQLKQQAASAAGYFYEFDGPFGVHASFTDNEWNGRRPDRTVAYYLAPPPAAPAATEPMLLDETSARAKVCAIGDEIHNLSCEQPDDALARRLGDFACLLWTLSQQLSSAPAAMPDDVVEVSVKTGRFCSTKTIPLALVETSSQCEPARFAEQAWSEVRAAMLAKTEGK